LLIINWNNIQIIHMFLAMWAVVGQLDFMTTSLMQNILVALVQMVSAPKNEGMEDTLQGSAAIG
jgi:hypothetical protein